MATIACSNSKKTHAVLGRAHRDAVGAVEARLAVHDAHAAGVEQLADAAREAGAQLAAPGLEALERDGHAVGVEPGGVQVARALRGVGQLDQRLAGDAADLQADPAEAGRRRARSTSVTSRPSCAARIAAA